MFQFSSQTIINSATDISGIAAFSATAGNLVVLTAGKFAKAKTEGLYKRAYSAGVKPKIEIAVPAGTTGKVLRLTVGLKLNAGSANSEYGQNGSRYFEKPITVEILSTGNATNNAAAFVTQLNKLYTRYGSKYFTASNAAAALTLEGVEDVQRFYNVTIELEGDYTAASYVNPEFSVIAGGILDGVAVNSTVNGVTVKAIGTLGFGDDAHMIRSIQVPTIENTRYFGIAKNERPVPGGNYSQYTLRYKVEKQDDGIVSGGYSITTHVFWVNSALVTAFEAAITTSTIALTTV